MQGKNSNICVIYIASYIIATYISKILKNQNLTDKILYYYYP